MTDNLSCLVFDGDQVAALEAAAGGGDSGRKKRASLPDGAQRAGIDPKPAGMERR